MRHPGPSQKPKPLNAQQLTALKMMVTGHNGQQIQEALGISQPTLYRWKQLPGWHLALQEHLKEIRQEGDVHLKSLVPLAAAALKVLVLTGNDTIKLGASRTILEAHANLVSREEQGELMVDLEQRLEELQALAQQQLMPAKAEVQDAEIVVDANADANAAADEVEVDF